MLQASELKKLAKTPSSFRHLIFLKIQYQKIFKLIFIYSVAGFVTREVYRVKKSIPFQYS